MRGREVALSAQSFEKPPSNRSPAEIELIVFDMDGVLYDLDRPKRLELLAELTDLDPSRIDVLTFGSAFELEAEAGAYPSGSDYLAEFNRRLGTNLTRLEWSGIRRKVMTPIPEVLELAENLASRCTIAVLTNNVSLVQESLDDIAPEVVRIFGANTHTSSRFGARKPEPEVFERLLTHHGTNPPNAVFIDDNPSAVAGSRKAGMNGILYTSPTDLREQLQRLGVDVGEPTRN